MSSELIELTLRVATRDQAQAVVLAEMLARMSVGLSAEPATQVSLDVERMPMCDHAHEHDEVGP
jgi:hypothetical protein